MKPFGVQLFFVSSFTNSTLNSSGTQSNLKTFRFAMFPSELFHFNKNTKLNTNSGIFLLYQWFYNFVFITLSLNCSQCLFELSLWFGHFACMFMCSILLNKFPMKKSTQNLSALNTLSHCAQRMQKLENFRHNKRYTQIYRIHSQCARFDCVLLFDSIAKTIVPMLVCVLIRVVLVGHSTAHTHIHTNTHNATESSCWCCVRIVFSIRIGFLFTKCLWFEKCVNFWL